MGNVNVKFNGKDFLLSCEDGQEEHLEELSLALNKKFNSLKEKLGNIGENKLLLITTISVMDEYFETKKNLNSKKNEIENIKKKFVELKSLVLDYKKEKDVQIESLKNNLSSLSDEFKKNINNYDSLIDSTAEKIEKFIKKNDENSIQ